jgi:excisionase family DNA binding protein
MPTLLTIKEICGLLRCSVPTVKRLLKRGELPVVRVGRRVLVRQEAVDAWIRAHETPATVSAPPRAAETSPPDRLARALQGSVRVVGPENSSPQATDR